MRRREQSDIQLPYLETFFKTAELGSFTAAGEELGMTQAAVSQRIHALEQSLGVAVFDRKAGRILLTDAGQRLYSYAQRLLALQREMIEEVTGKKPRVSGELLLAASSIPGEHLLSGLLSVFRTQFPEIRVRATVVDSLAALEQVQRGKVHLGLVGRKDDNPHLEFRVFARDEMVIVVPPDHRWKKSRQISLKQLSTEPFIVREPGSGSRWCLERALAGTGRRLQDLRIALELGSNESIKDAVLKGMGVAALSSLAVQKEVASGQLFAVKVKDVALDRTLFVVWDKRRALPAPAAVFLRFLERCPDSL
jgi:DNA-binding transcriptional LysR family regulator